MPNKNLDKTAQLESDNIKITVSQSFPQIIDYTWKSRGSKLYANKQQLSQISINNHRYTPSVNFTQTKNNANYKLTVSEIDVVVDVKIAIEKNIISLDVTQVEENGDFKINEIAFPEHHLIAVNSSQAGASFAGAKMYTDVKGSGDTYQQLTINPIQDKAAQGYMYGFLNTNELAAAIWTNAVVDHPKEEDKNDNTRVYKQTIKNANSYTTGLWSGSWVYRAEGSTVIEALPAVKIIITRDQNLDGIVNWQDSAIAFRQIMNNPKGSDRIADLVIQRIPMNFASLTTNPFLKTLDETKRLYLATDGLGQLVLLKGYQSEGHDSAHPDYAGNINKNAGGVRDLNVLINKGHKYNADFGVHLNAQESYPEAKSFNEELVIKETKGWGWLDQSYIIDKRYDATSGNRWKRLQALQKEVPELDFIYLDVWYQHGWENRKIANEFKEAGWWVGTEFANAIEWDSIWYHWAVDVNYGDFKRKGYNSKIVRFIRNHQKDSWIARHPLLGGTEIHGYEGWQSRVNFKQTIDMVFDTTLPSKFLQHYPILRWQDDSIAFENDVLVTGKNAVRKFYQNDRLILKGNHYLLPWAQDSKSNQKKLYHWNKKGGITHWQLPDDWRGNKYVWLYQLTDKGRILVSKLSVLDNWININAVEKTPYVVYQEKAPKQDELIWGEGSLIKDPGFNANNLHAWKIQAEDKNVSITQNKRYQNQLTIGTGKQVTLTQALGNLLPGQYVLTTHIEIIDKKRKAIIGVKNNNIIIASKSATRSTAINYNAADEKSATKSQRMHVFFEVTNDMRSVELFLAVENGVASVHFDNLRLVNAKPAPLPTNAIYAENFEQAIEGWYPFVKGDAGGVNDPLTHLSELHAPYTQQGWNGKLIDDVISGNWSLKSNDEHKGIIYRTIAQTWTFEKNKSYKIHFDYQSSHSGKYEVIVGAGDAILATYALTQALSTTTFTMDFTAKQDTWFGIQSVTKEEGDLVIDNITVY